MTLADDGTLTCIASRSTSQVVIEDVVASYQGVGERDRVQVVADIAPGLPLLDADPLRLREVLTNLVSNAVRYASRPGEVRVAASGADGWIEVRVLDSGSGIDPELLPRVFERFAKDPKSPGFGLGLAIARGLVESHGGTLTASSVPGRGTTMTIRLPVTPERD